MLNINQNKFKLLIEDSLSGDTHTFYYRAPTTEETVNVCNAFMEEKDKTKAAQILAKGSVPLLLGFEKGSIAVDDKLISSDPEDEDYYENWKALISANAERLLIEIGTTVYLKTKSYVKKKT